MQVVVVVSVTVVQVFIPPPSPRMYPLLLISVTTYPGQVVGTWKPMSYQ